MDFKSIIVVSQQPSYLAGYLSEVSLMVPFDHSKRRMTHSCDTEKLSEKVPVDHTSGHLINLVGVHI